MISLAKEIFPGKKGVYEQLSRRSPSTTGQRSSYVEVVGGVGSAGSTLGGGQQVREVVPRWLHPPAQPGTRLWRLRAVVGGRRPLVPRAGVGADGGSGTLVAGVVAHEAACPSDPGGGGGRGFAGGRRRVEVDLVGGLGPGKHAVGGQRDAGLGLQLGAAALAADLPYAVLPVGGTGRVGPMPLGELQVLVGVPLLQLSQPAHRLGPFPCQQAGPAQRVGAGDGQLCHLGDHMGDVVLVSDEAAPHYGLEVGERLQLKNRHDPEGFDWSIVRLEKGTGEDFKIQK